MMSYLRVIIKIHEFKCDVAYRLTYQTVTKFEFVCSIMMTHIRQSRSRKHLRRTYLTRRTEQTVSTLLTPLKIMPLPQYISNAKRGGFLCPLGEIALLEGLTVVYKSNIDLFFYVIGSSHENEVSSILGFVMNPF